MCYRGFGRGVLAEALNLVGAVSAVALTVNYAGWVTGPMRQLVSFDPLLAGFLTFWGVFVIVLLSLHAAVRSLGQLVKWEPFHWTTRGVGLVLGGLRGIWWSGVLLLAFSASGFLYLQESVAERSILGPRLMGLSQQRLDQVLTWLPAGQLQGQTLFPAFKQAVRKHQK